MSEVYELSRKAVTKEQRERILRFSDTSCPGRGPGLWRQ